MKTVPSEYTLLINTSIYHTVFKKLREPFKEINITLKLIIWNIFLALGSEVLTGRLNCNTGEVTIIDRKAVHGRSTCQLAWDSDRSHIIAVSYWDSKITTFPVKADGSLSEASEVSAQVHIVSSLVSNHLGCWLNIRVE